MKVYSVAMWSMRHSLGAIPLLVSLLCGAMSFAIHAQAVDGLVPGPLTSEEFDRWLASLDLSHEERIAIEAAHERYKEAYRRFRDSEVSRAVSEIEPAQSNAAQSGEAARLQWQDALVSQLRAIDQRLFNELTAALAAHHLRSVDSFARISQRRYARDLSMERGVQVAEMPDLAKLVRTYEAASGQSRQFESLISECELAVVDLEQQYIEAHIAWRKQRDEAGAQHRQIGPDGQSRIDRGVLEEADTHTWPKLAAAEQALRAENRQWAQRLEAMLAPSDQRLFRWDWLGAVYLDTLPPSRGGWIPFVSAYRRAGEEMTAEGRAAADALADGFFAEMDDLVTRAIPLIDEYQQIRVASGRYWPDAPDHERSLQEISDSMSNVQNRWGEMLYATMREHRLPARAARLSGQPSMCIRPASEPQMRWMTRVLHLTEQASEIAFHVFQDYLEECWRMEERHRAAAGVLTTEQRGVPEERLAHATRLRDARFAAAAELEEIDERLIEDLLALAPGETGDFGELLRRERSRQRINIGEGWSASVEDGFPDVIEIARFIMLETPSIHVEETLAGAHDALAAVLGERHRLLCERSMISELDEMETERARRQGSEARRAHRRTDELRDRLNGLERNFVGLSLDCAERIEQLLPGGRAQAFQESFLAAAYPSALGGSSSARGAAGRVLEVASLSPVQAEGVAEVLSDHDASMDWLTARLIAQPVGNRLTPFERQLATAVPDLPFHHRYRALDLDRRELNVTTLRRVRALLTAEQAAEWDAATRAAAPE